MRHQGFSPLNQNRANLLNFRPESVFFTLEEQLMPRQRLQDNASLSERLNFEKSRREQLGMHAEELAKDLSQMQGFFNMCVHDLRGPVVALVNSLEHVMQNLKLVIKETSEAKVKLEVDPN